MQGITFKNGESEIHTYVDLNLVLSEIKIPPPNPKTIFIDLPGGDGTIDLTDAFGETKYYDRECEFTFTVFPTDDVIEKKKIVNNLLNGRRFQIILDDDPLYYWDGRCYVTEYVKNKKINKITIKATVSPYKMKVHEITVLFPAGENTQSLTVGRKTVVPTLTHTASATILYNGNSYTIGAGTHQIPELQLVQGTHEITVTSDKAVWFIYRDGDL